MMKKYIIFPIFILCILSSCKPTEKGYKSAYDAAIGKRQAALEQILAGISEDTFQQFDGPQLKEINGVKIYFLNQKISPANDLTMLPGQYNVAVGAYKMITNSRAQAEVLREEGYEAFPAKDPEETYYTIAGSLPTLEEAVNLYQQYKSGDKRVYVGLPSSPVIIYSPR